MSSSLDKTINAMRKRWGEGAIFKLGDEALNVETVSTGSLTIDYALGVGGLPRGRVTEIYGPESSGKTTLCLHVVAEAQKQGLVCAFIDMEHALDPSYARRIGVNTDELYVAQPDTGEQALEMAENLTLSGGVGVIVIDSVAALVPRAEIEGDMGDAHVGLQARLMSQALRKLAGPLKKTNTLLIFTNQIRMKIGVMFGCFNYSTRVTLADGTQEKIGKIVNQRLPVEVLAFDPETGEVKPRKVIGWHDNGPTGSFIRFVCETAGGGNGRSTFACTPDHEIYVPGFDLVRAKDLSIGDYVLTRGDLVFNDHQRIAALSQVLGDGSVRKMGLRSQLRVKHGYKQKDYALWKEGLFGDLVGSIEEKHGDFYGFDLSPSCDLNEVFDGYSLIREIGVRGVALWLMDDSTFGGSFAKWGWGKVSLSVKRWANYQREGAAQALEDIGLPKPTVASNGRLVWSGERVRDLHKVVAPFVPQSMRYKIHPNFHNIIGTASWDREPNRRSILIPSVVKDKYEVRPNGRATHRFDLTVEGDHNYLVDGCAVHNSPETTSGGKALKFYSSVRLDIRRIGAIKAAGNVVVGNRTRVKVKKNKVAPPFTEAEFDILYNQGISIEGEIVDLGTEFDVIEKRGSYYSFTTSEGKEEKVQGRDNYRDMLEKNPELATEILTKIREAMGI